MKRQRAIAALVLGILVILAVLSISGCAMLRSKPKAVHAGAVTAASVAEALNALEKINESLYDSRPRLVDYYETVAISEGIRLATIANDAFIDRVKALKQANTNDPTQVVSLFGNLSAALDDLNHKGVLAVKNPQSRDRLSAAFQLVKSAADAIAVNIAPKTTSFRLPAPGEACDFKLHSCIAEGELISTTWNGTTPLTCYTRSGGSLIPDPCVSVPHHRHVEPVASPTASFEAGACTDACSAFLNWNIEAGSVVVTPDALKGEKQILSTPSSSDDAPSGPRALLWAGLADRVDRQTDLQESDRDPAPLLAIDALALANLLSLAISLFGVGSQVVKTIHAESGMTDDELLAAGLLKDQETRDAIAEHLDAVKKEFTGGPAVASTEGG